MGIDPLVDGRVDAVVDLVGLIEVGVQVGGERQQVCVEADQSSIQLHSTQREGAQVDVAAAVAARDVMVGVVAYAFAQRMFIHGLVVVPHVGQPVHGITPPIEARASRRVAGRQIYAASRQVQVFRDLCTGLARPDDQYRSFGQGLWIAVIGRV
jgi:hypothetical protein